MWFSILKGGRALEHFLYARFSVGGPWQIVNRHIQKESLVFLSNSVISATKEDLLILMIIILILFFTNESTLLRSREHKLHLKPDVKYVENDEIPSKKIFQNLLILNQINPPVLCGPN